MADYVLLGIGAISSLFSTGLFVAGATGWSTVYVNFYNIAWSFFGATLTDGGDVVYNPKFFVSLQGIVAQTPDGSSQTGFVSYQEIITGSQAGKTLEGISNTGDWAQSCQTAGETAFALTLTALFLSAILFIITITRFVDNSILSKVWAILASFFAVAASVTAFTNWHVNCFLNFRSNGFRAIDPNTPGLDPNVTYYEYYGFNVVVAGFALSVLSFLLNCLTSSPGSAITSSSSSSAPIAEPEKANDNFSAPAAAPAAAPLEITPQA